MKKLLFFAFTSLILSHGFSQTKDQQWNIGIYWGATQYNGDLGNDFYKTGMPFYGFGAVSVSRLVSSHIDLQLFATRGSVGFNRHPGYFSNNLTTATLNLRFHLLQPEAVVRPYLLAGFGAMVFDKKLNITNQNLDFATPSAGAGINFKMGPTVVLNLQETFLFSNRDSRDGIVKDNNDAFLLHSAGVSFNFGKKKDSDKDGVADRIDKCANTPAMVVVDKKGCPVDTDADGLADYLDSCPDIAGMLNGCPDQDGDGIVDKEDRCPEVAGTKLMKGCADTDGDGVADVDDKCAGTKKGYSVDASGCSLDNDKDGVVNEEDRCPDAAGTIGLKGCPDTDGDGVADIEDLCLTVKGTKSNSGCPEITKEVETKITNIAGKIFFETNSDILKVASLSELDELVLILNQYPYAKLSIGGHTDSQGSDAFNMLLSQKRSGAVTKYLISKGIAQERLTGTGYGESVPVADNTTAAGRAKNRRVELKTSY
ncbi:MAG TPA: OmpA family protein [Lacibacter sp.]|nr:OmpA family protein [Lacibacter sp.]